MTAEDGHHDSASPVVPVFFLSDSTGISAETMGNEGLPADDHPAEHVEDLWMPGPNVTQGLRYPGFVQVSALRNQTYEPSRPLAGRQIGESVSAADTIGT